MGYSAFRKCAENRTTGKDRPAEKACRLKESINKIPKEQTSFKKWFGKRAGNLKQKAITDILPVFNVEVDSVKANDYQDFYDIAIREYLN